MSRPLIMIIVYLHHYANITALRQYVKGRSILGRVCQFLYGVARQVQRQILSAEFAAPQQQPPVAGLFIASPYDFDSSRLTSSAVLLILLLISVCICAIMQLNAESHRSNPLRSLSHVWS